MSKNIPNSQKVAAFYQIINFDFCSVAVIGLTTDLLT